MLAHGIKRHVESPSGLSIHFPCYMASCQALGRGSVLVVGLGWLSLTGISSLTVRVRFVRRALQTSGFKRPLLARLVLLLGQYQPSQQSNCPRVDGGELCAAMRRKFLSIVGAIQMGTNA